MISPFFSHLHLTHYIMCQLKPGGVTNLRESEEVVEYTVFRKLLFLKIKFLVIFFIIIKLFQLFLTDLLILVFF